MFPSPAQEQAVARWYATARRIRGLDPLRAAVDEQRWLVRVLQAERQATPREERDAFDARCERTLARLDPPLFAA